MGVPFHRRSLLVQGAATAASIAGASALGLNLADKRLALDLPYSWLDRAVWAVISTPKVQNWNNSTTPTGAAAYGMIGGMTGGSIWPTQIWLS
jgi:hypothetical protein